MPAFPIQPAVQTAYVRPPSAVAPLPACRSPGCIGRRELLACCKYLSSSLYSCLEPAFITCTERPLSQNPDCPGNCWPPCSVLQPPLCQCSSCFPAVRSLTPGALGANWTCSSLLIVICLGIPVLDHGLLLTQLYTWPRCSPAGC